MQRDSITPVVTKSLKYFGNSLMMTQTTKKILFALLLCAIAVKGEKTLINKK